MIEQMSLLDDAPQGPTAAPTDLRNDPEPQVNQMGLRVVLEVSHRQRWKMAAKVFRPEGWDRPICLHESSGSQPHRNLASPGGVDRRVLEWLWDTAGVMWFFHFDKKRHECFSAHVLRIIRDGIPQTSDGRDRLYLPYHGWTMTTGLPFAVPWVKDVIRL